MKRCVFLFATGIALTCRLLPVCAQAPKLDSLLAAASVARQDTNAVRLFSKICDAYTFAGQLDKAKACLYRMKSLSEKLDYNYGRLLSAYNATYVYLGEGHYDSIIVCNGEALRLAERLGKKSQVAFFSMNMGIGYRMLGKFSSATEYYSKALSYYEAQADSANIGFVSNNLALVYWHMKQLQKALDYGHKAETVFRRSGNELNHANCLLTLAKIYDDLSMFDESIKAANEALEIAVSKGFDSMEETAYLNLCSALHHAGRFDYKPYAEKALAIATANGSANIAVAGINLGYALLHEGNFAEAKAKAREGLSRGLEMKSQQYVAEAYTLLSFIAYAEHDYRNAARYESSADSVRSRLVNEQVLRATTELEVQYDTEKKEARIETLEEEKRLNRMLTLAGGAAMLLALVALLLAWRANVQKRRKAEIQYKQAEQEKQLVAARAVLDGETAERTRLASDLHDGLGGMLSSVKLNLMSIKHGVMLENYDAEGFDRVLTMLDASIGELRRVSHNMMPESLSRAGLKDALHDFCDSVSIASFNWSGVATRLDPKLEVMVYRVVSELVNNAMKHAGAKHIYVQLVLDAQRLSFTVEDDGCGFDTQALHTGAGLNNIRSRMAAFGGYVELNSIPGEGTEVIGEVKW